MNRLRYGLIAGICAVSYLLFLEWNAFQDAARSAGKTEQATISSAQAQQSSTAAASLPSTTAPANSDEGLPSFSEVDDNVSSTLPVVQPEPPTATLVHVKTDSFDIAIDTLGGDIVRVALPKHLADINSSEAFTLMNRTESQTYVAQSGLIGPNGTDTTSTDRPVYSVSSRSYTMSENDDTLEVDLVLKQAQATITKRYTFTRDSYLVNVDYIVQNKSTENWRAAPYGQIRRNEFDVESSVGFGMQPFLGAALTTNEKNYNKMSFSDIAEDTFVASKEGGWVSMVQHYFISAWVPDQQAQNKYKLYDVPSTGLYILEYTGQPVSIAPGQTDTLSSAFYAGPKNLKALEEISPFLDLTLDYSFLWFIAKPLFFALDFIQGFVINWGIAIILLTMLIKLVFLYPSAMSYRSMAKMRKLQPMMAELKERYGEDRQKMSSELMKLYKTEKVNPLGGCLPILLQMPVFISLYWVLMESVELRHAPFFLWITDLSIKDPYFILPLIMGFTMFIQQKLNPTPPDPMQAKVMQMMPFFFTILFLMFPAGLVLYWVVNNTLSITQQYIITKQIEKSS